MEEYRIGTFNCLYGRNPRKVLDEIKHACLTNRLDVLIVQEAKDYYHGLLHLYDFNYYCGVTSDSHKQVGILVNEQHGVTRVRLKEAGDGWRTEGGAYHGPVATPQLLVNGKLAVKGVHLPTPSMWKNGKLHGPPERVDDLKATMSQITTWFKPKKGSNAVKVVGGDWNEPPTTKGEFSPSAIAAASGAHIHSTNQKSPHGNIDYFMVKGLYQFKNMYQDDELQERSDHELRVLVVKL
jgi:hypothetical protein